MGYGSNSTDPSAAYGPIGTWDPNYNPGARSETGVCMRLDDSVCLFGGLKEIDSLSDLYCFSPACRQWAIMNGSQVANQPGKYNEPGVASRPNAPGHARAPSRGRIPKETFGCSGDLDKWTVHQDPVT